MQKLRVSRKKLREIVAVSFKKYNEEQLKTKKKIHELAGLPFDSGKEEKNATAIIELIIEPYTDNLLGMTSDEEFFEIIGRSIVGYLEEKTSDLQKLTEKENQKIQNAFTDVMANIIAEFKPHDSRKKALQYYNCLFKLAKQNKVTPQSIFESDAAYREFMRKVYSREEYKVNREKALALLNPDKIMDLFLKSFLGAMEVDEEEYSELYAEMKKEITTNPELQERLAVVKTVVVQVMEEELIKIYGN